jgi:transposase-like protein
MNERGGAPRAQPFYCPYCGEEDFVPFGGNGQYHCHSCDRRFGVRFLGLGGGEPVKDASTAGGGEDAL